MDLLEFVQMVGVDGGSLLAQVGALVFAYRALVTRVDKLEGEISARLNNGIRSKLEELNASVARIEGRCELCSNNVKVRASK